MNLFEFSRRFDAEEKFRAFLKDEREKHSIQYKNCDGREQFYLEKKKLWQLPPEELMEMVIERFNQNV